MSSLHRGHANLLWIVPILVYVLPKWAQIFLSIFLSLKFKFFHLSSLASDVGLAFLFKGLWILIFLGLFYPFIGCCSYILRPPVLGYLIFTEHLWTLIQFLQRFFCKSGLTESPMACSLCRIHLTCFCVSTKGCLFNIYLHYNVVWGRKTFSSAPLVSSGWSKKQIDVRHINRRKSNKSLVTGIHGTNQGESRNLSEWPKPSP